MSKTYIPRAIKQRVAIAAKHRCGYCLTRSALIGMPLEIDHIIPEALGGSSDESNLWLACPTCNLRKWFRTIVVDSHTGQPVALFNPRQQKWQDHFAWDADSLFIIGLTAIGRATVETLDMNNSYIVRSRSLWVRWGEHPPKD